VNYYQNHRSIISVESVIKVECIMSTWCGCCGCEFRHSRMGNVTRLCIISFKPQTSKCHISDNNLPSQAEYRYEHSLTWQAKPFAAVSILLCMQLHYKRLQVRSFTARNAEWESDSPTNIYI